MPTNHTSTIATGLGKFIYAVGTKTKFDYGTYIFDQIMKHAGTTAVKLPIAFPSLICGIILRQYPGILTDKDSVCKRDSALSFHYKLFHGSHVPDIVMTSAGTSENSRPINKSTLIAELKETCKELANRKLKLQKIIQMLEQDGGNDVNDGDDVNEGNGKAEADDDEKTDSEAVGSEEAEEDDGSDGSSD